MKKISMGLLILIFSWHKTIFCQIFRKFEGRLLQKAQRQIKKKPGKVKKKP
jgi:hypothetical protein